MRIGLTGGASSVDGIVRQVARAEEEGFSTVWFPGAVAGDPLVALAIAGRATDRIELGTSVLQTYTCHPGLMAQRAAAVVAAIGEPGRFTLGIGPSHRPVVEDVYGLSYDSPGRHTEEYLDVLAPLLRGEPVDRRGAELGFTGGPPALAGGEPIPILLAALAPRLLRVAGEQAQGTITWMANAAAIRDHVAPRIAAAASAAGRPDPRVVAGLPVAVHDDVAEARAVAAEQFAVYATLPNYRRVLAHGGVDGPGEAAIVGDEATVAAALHDLVAAGATDVWAAPFPGRRRPVGVAPAHAGAAPRGRHRLSVPHRPRVCRRRRATAADAGTEGAVRSD
ncbi:TIGR03564 family F420-dependent LLM class oxidoreductase [Dermatobacter hominis]|nr:TIGR03564 family F420-dependent LLM class oxidoreductase [Dermatobacter hominis]UDY37418.1 TIGR03564 family F420-dependent LLM class oxidoreductase [Dermatobacter hominis]